MADPVVFHDNPDPTGEFPNNVAIHSGFNDTHELQVEGPSLVGQPTATTGPAKKVPVDAPLYFDAEGDLNIDLTALAEAQAAITVLQGRITADEATITALQGQQATNVAAIATLQTARLADEANITALQAQANYLQQQINAMVIKFYPTANALFAGSGGLTASLRQISQIQETFAGAGNLIAVLGLNTSLVPYVFAGQGNLTAVASNVLAILANWSGAGGFNANSLTGALSASALFSGSGALSAMLNTTFSVNAEFDGAGSLTANLIRPIYITPPLMAGAGSLTASLGNLMAASGFAGPNVVLNPTGSGAVTGTPGTVPTTWTRTAAGITVSVPTIGTDGSTGIPYVDFGFVGTATGTSALISFGSASGVNSVPAAPGQTWLASFWFGITTDDPDVTAHELILYALNSSGTGTQSVTLVLPRTTGVFRQYYLSSLVFPANTVAILARYAATYLTGAALNFTVRIGAISVVQTNPAGVGTLTADLTKVTGWQALANFNGAGGLSITDSLLNTLQAANASMAGAGSLSVTDALVNSLQTANASLAGSGGLVAAPAQLMRISGITGPNMANNPSASGGAAGTPGTVPTGWTRNPSAGLAVSIPSVGTLNGVNYVDFNFVGTPSQTNSNILFGPLSGVGTIPAVPGQIWLGSLYFAVLQDDPNIINHELLVYALDVTGAITRQQLLILPRTAPFTQYFNLTAAVNPVNTVAVTLRYFANWTPGSAMNFTVRLGAPSLVQNNPAGAGSLTANLTGGH